MHGWHFHHLGPDEKPFDPRLLLRSLQFVKPHMHRMLGSVMLVTVAIATDLAGPYLLKVAIDSNIAKGDYQGLTRTALLYVGTTLVSACTSALLMYIMSWTGQRIAYDMRLSMFSHLQRASLRFFDANEAGAIMSRLTNDVDALDELLANGLIELMRLSFTLFGTIAIMVSMNLRLSLWTFTILPFIVLASFFFQRRATRVYRRTREKIASVTASLEESITGVRVIKSFSRERANVREFQEVNLENRMANLEAALVRSVYMPTVDILGTIGMGIVLWVGGRSVIGGQVEVGVLVAFISYIWRFFGPIRMLAMLYNGVLAAMASAERIFEVLDTKPEVADPAEPLPLDGLEAEVEFKGVSFSYEPGVPVLQDIDIKVPANSTIALVGPTGAGKSTLVSLLTRFYDPDEGAVRVDGMDLRDLKVLEYRSQIGMVLQDGFLFSGSILENIRYGNPSASDEEITAAAEAIGADEVIMRFPEGYQTDVRERGGKLSIGERQLICLARALVADPRILILDEATSSVDPYTELLIQRALEKVFQTRTSVVIAHRLSTVRQADKIYVLNEGRVVEEGTHQELLAKGGLYQHLYEMQFRLQEEATQGS